MKTRVWTRALALVSILASTIVGVAAAADGNDPTRPASKKTGPWNVVILLDPASTELTPLSLVQAGEQPRESVSVGLLSRYGSPKAVRTLAVDLPSRVALDKRVLPDYGGAERTRATLEDYVAAFHPEELLRRYLILSYETEAQRSAALALINSKEARHILFAEAEDWDLTFASVTPTDAFFSSSTNFVPTSPLTSEAKWQWGMTATKFPEAWSRSTGYGYVAVVDGGLRDETPGITQGFDQANDPLLHPDLQRNVRPRWSSAVGVEAPYGVFAGWATDNLEQHGTHVVGIIGAAATPPGSGPGDGVAGACWDCSIAMYRTAAGASKPTNWPVPSYTPTALNLADGVRRAAQHGFQTLSLSAANFALSSNYCNDNVASPPCVAFTLAQAYGISLVASNGNQKNNNLYGGIGWPARDSRWIAVAGTQYSADINAPKLWVDGYTTGEEGSNKGPETAIAAPAKDIVSTIRISPTGNDYVPAVYCGDSYGPRPSNLSASQLDGYGTCTGTSMSAPLVAGALMVIRSANPLLNPSQLKSIIGSTAIPCRTAGGAIDVDCGPGSLNVDQAVIKALDYERTTPRETVVNRTVPLMAAYSSIGANHFYTTIPQMMRAAVNGTAMPRPLPKFSGTWIKQLPKQTVAQGNSCLLTLGLYRPCYNFSPADFSHAASNNTVVPNVSVRITVQSWNNNGTKAYDDVMSWNRTDANGKIQNDVFFHFPAPDQTSVLVEVANFFGNLEETQYYNPVGNTIPGGTGWFPSCSSLPPSESCLNSTPLAIASVFTTNANPLGGSPLVPLYRMSMRCADTVDTSNGSNYNSACSSNPQHVSHVYTTSTSFRTAMQTSTSPNYRYDGLEGYIYPTSLSQPAGTVKLCRKFDATRGDWVLFPGAGSGGTDCSATYNSYTNGGSYSDCKGDTSLQSVNCGSASSNDNWIGWVPVLSYPAPVLPVSAGTNTISGQILYNGSPLQGVTLGAPGASCTLTDSGGNYVCTVQTTFSGTIEPTLASYGFNPYYRTYSNVTSNLTGEDYEAHDATVNILGWMVRPNNQGIGGVALSAPGLNCSVTSYSGFYNCEGPWGYNGYLTPAATPGWWFNPPSRYLGPSIQVSGYYDGFVGKRPTVKGVVKRADGTAIQNVKLVGAQAEDTSPNCFTTSTGTYTCTVEVGFTGTITPQKTGCTFSPTGLSYTNYQTNLVNQNYTASATCAP